MGCEVDCIEGSALGHSVGMFEGVDDGIILG